MSKKNKNKNLKTSKLIRLLSKLSPKTVKQFKAWYKMQGSPKRDAFLVLTYLLLNYPTFDSSNLDQEFAFKKIFGKVPYDYRRLMKTISQVHLDLKQYLVHLELAEDDFLNDFLLAKVYTKYQLQNELDLLLDKKRNKEIKKPIINSPQHFYEQMQWHHIDFYRDGKNKLNAKEHKLNDAISNLDWYFLGLKLKYLCDIESRQVLLGVKYTTQFSEAIQNYCLANYEQLPLFHQLYWMSWQLIVYRKEDIYFELKQIFIDQHYLLEKEDQLILFTYLFNFVAHQLRNNRPYLREAFEWYQMSIEKDILFSNQIFVEVHFSNLVNIACALKEFNWLENTLEHQLAPALTKLSPSVHYLGLARLAFAKQDFLKCRGYLMNIDYNQFFYSSRARHFQLMCAYELKESPASIEANCKSFENYLRRHERVTKNLDPQLNFIHFIRSFIKVQPNKQKLLKKLGTTKTIFKPWINEKINELKD